MFTSRSKKIADNLRRAASEIEERGWTYGTRQNHTTGEVCALGAIGIASGVGPEASVFSTGRKANLYRDTVKVLGGENVVYKWNDALYYNRVHASNVIGGREVASRFGRLEVVTKLRAAADALDAPKTVKQPTAGDIGKIKRRVDAEPLYAPGQEPVHEPAAPAVEPELVPA